MIQEADEDGNLPIHAAARVGADAILAMLTKLDPESALVINGESENLLHCATYSATAREMHTSTVAWVCSRYPQMMMQRDSEGRTPLILALNQSSMDAAVDHFLIEAGWRDVAVAAVVHPTSENYEYNGYLPLHYAVEHDNCTAIEMLLRLYPEAAGIEGGTDDTRNTPYDIARYWNCLERHERVLLRAAPTLDPAMLHNLNWEERRMAMFLAFRAVSRRASQNVLARLRFENKDLVKHVVSFL
jgi:ankyrin repeat protein